ncbi:MAG: SH3 domain-containing protein [Chloroflexi bacterium]|nr:SH3 domain-containing protein [Chloroflexota bacterium]
MRFAMKSRWHAVTAIVVVLAVTGALLVNVTYAADIAVDFATDADGTLGALANDGSCSLREALENANSTVSPFQPYTDCDPGSAGADTITFSVGTVTLVSNIFVVTDVTIQGPVTIDGGGTTNMFVAASSGNGILRLDEVTLQNGSSTSGGAILMQGGTVVCTESSFQDNAAEFDGGAIVGNGTLNLNACIFERNTADRNGGAISHNGADPITMDGAVFRQNEAGAGTGGGYGGALYVTSPGTITGSAFDRNTTNVADQTGGGGAIYHAGATLDPLVITASAFSGNSVDGDESRGGAIYSSGGAPLSINYSHFGTTPLPLPAPFDTLTEGNSVNGANGIGGAIFLNGETQILGSSFIGNTSAGNGGALSYGSFGDDITVANSTFSNNSTEINGGAIYNFRDDSLIRLTNVTISNNSASNGGGIFNEGDGDNFDITSDEILLENSIVYNNSAPTNPNCGGGTVSSDGPGNVIPAGECASAPGVNGSPNLGSPELTFSIPSIVTYTLPLGSGSAALGAGDQSICAAFPILNLDQRAFPRPQGDANCDAGAYESSQIGATPTPTPSNTPTPTDTPEPATNTPTPTETNTPEPATNTPTPTETSTSEPATNTPTPTETNTPEPATNTPTPTETLSVVNTDTPSPSPTNTVVAATDTPSPSPTSTPAAPTDTPSPTATSTLAAATDTPSPTATSTLAAPTDTPSPTATSTLAASTDTPSPTATSTLAAPTDTPSATTTSTLAAATDTPAPGTETPTPTPSGTAAPGTATPTPTPSMTPLPSGGGGPSGPKVEVFLCDNLADQSDEAMIAYGGIGNVMRFSITGNVFCRIIVKDAQVITSLAEIGVDSVVQAGVVQAVDMFGLLPDGSPVVPFISPMTICLRGSGSAIFLSAANASRTALSIPILPNSPAGYSCGSIPESGTVVLVGGGISAPLVQQPHLSETPESVALSNCQVRATNPLNLRSTPSLTDPSNIIEVLPYQTLLTSTERIPGWYRVIRNGLPGWVAADFVEKIGNC